MLRSLFILFLSTSVFAGPQVNHTVAKVFPNYPSQGKNEGKPLYEIKIAKESEGSTERTRMVYLDQNGKELSEQVIRYENGAPVEYSIKHPDSKTDGKISVSEKEISIEMTVDGKAQAKKLSKPDAYVIGPSLNRFMQAHIEDLQKGKTVKFQMVVLHLLDTIGMKLEKEDSDEPEVKAGKWIRVEMKPTSFIYNTLSPKLTFFLDAKTGKTILYLGPVGAIKSDEKIKGTIRYDES